MVSTEKRKEFLYFSARLKELKEAGNLSQAAIADMVGVTQPTVQAWLNATSGPHIGQLIILADRFRLPTVDELIRPVPEAGERCVVPMRVLQEVAAHMQEATNAIRMILDHPVVPTRQKPRRKRRHR